MKKARDGSGQRLTADGRVFIVGNIRIDARRRKFFSVAVQRLLEKHDKLHANDSAAPRHVLIENDDFRAAAHSNPAEKSLPDSRTEEPSTESDFRKSEAFQAYLISKRERAEVYRRLAES